MVKEKFDVFSKISNFSSIKDESKVKSNIKPQTTNYTDCSFSNDTNVNVSVDTVNVNINTIPKKEASDVDLSLAFVVVGGIVTAIYPSVLTMIATLSTVAWVFLIALTIGLTLEQAIDFLVEHF